MKPTYLTSLQVAARLFGKRLLGGHGARVRERRSRVNRWCVHRTATGARSEKDQIGGSAASEFGLPALSPCRDALTQVVGRGAPIDDRRRLEGVHRTLLDPPHDLLHTLHGQRREVSESCNAVGDGVLECLLMKATASRPRLSVR